MAFNVSSLFRISQPLALDGAWNVETLAGNRTLTDSDSVFQAIDPDGARDMLLPRVSKTDEGRFFVIMNKANGAETITVKDYADVAITNGDIDRQVAGVFYVTAGAWVLVGKLTMTSD